MSLKVHTRIPYGNARAVSVRDNGDMPEVSFAADPQGGPEALWFCFRLVEADETSAQKVRLTLRFTRNMLGMNAPETCHPTYRPEGQGWFRTKSGELSHSPDGQVSVSWLIPYPSPSTEVAFCFPYGRPEIDHLLKRSKGYWKKDEIGLSQDGRVMIRLSNDYGGSAQNRFGVYMVARQHAGETPGSWVMDGVLERFSRTHKTPCTVWASPLADIDGIVHGSYGKDAFPHDLNRAWGQPPMRHETMVLQNDIRRWTQRCKASLILDFHAPGGSDAAGVFCSLPHPETNAAIHKESVGWANVMRDSIGKEYVADDFARVADAPSRWEHPQLADFADTLGVPMLSIETPYSSCGTTLLAQKHYREIGKRIAVAIMNRNR